MSSLLIVDFFYFQVVAQEIGGARQSATANVVVNIVDINDNPPVFEKEEYRHVSMDLHRVMFVFLRITIRENIAPGTKVVQVGGNSRKDKCSPFVVAFTVL